MSIKRVGVIGGGQLAWMMRGAANNLGVKLVIQTPSPDDPGASIADEVVFAPVDNAIATAKLATKCDVITFENEFVNLDDLFKLSQQGVCFRPRLAALNPLLDKYHQRCYLRSIGLPVPQFMAVVPEEWQSQRDAFVEQFGFPVVLKTRRHGYDGQGTFIVPDLVTLESKLKFDEQGQSLFLLEEFIAFERELAVMAARSSNGEISIFPVVETQQSQQVCRWAIAPAHITPQIIQQIEYIACTILKSLDVVGIFGIELFLTNHGLVLVNEIAPRTHNAGHFSLDACFTSQFEQHIRAICDLPLGNPNLICGCAIMVNLLGYENSESDYLQARQKLQQIPRASVHWYGKNESHPGRKLGHVTVLHENQNRDQLMAIAHQIESIWYPK